jgi:hypothetical protein
MKLADVTSLQRLDGSWDNPAALIALAKVDVAAPASLDGKSEAKAIFATAVAVAILRTRFAQRRASWTMIERKALEWLAERIEDPEQLIAEIVTLLST